MKRKFILRLLAVVMAASLTATSVPSGLFSAGTETVFAAVPDTPSALTKGDLAIETHSISIKADASKDTMQYLLVEKNANKVDPDTSVNWIDGQTKGTATELGTVVSGTAATEDSKNLKANRTYIVYQRVKSTGDGASKASPAFEVTTNKISIANAVVNLSNTTFTYTGNAIEPTLKDITPDGETKIDDANTLTNFSLEYFNNENVHVATGDDAPYVKITGTGDYEGETIVRFAITEFDLTAAAAAGKVLVSVNDVTSGNASDILLDYNGLQQNPDIVIKAQTDPDSKEYKTLTLGKDFRVSFEESANSSSKGSSDNLGTATDQTRGESRIDYNIDAGTVTAVLYGTGNYTGKVNGEYTIRPIDTTAPSKPVIKESATTDVSFTIDTSDEDGKYAYEYLILDKESDKDKIKWDETNTTVITSAAGTKSDIVLTCNGTATTSDSNHGTTTLKVINSNNNLILEANKTYYVVRRIAKTANNTASGISEVTEVKMAATDIARAVNGTRGQDEVVRKEGVKTDIDLTDNSGSGGENYSSNPHLKDFDKIYDGKAQLDTEVTLYDDNSTKTNPIPTNLYTIKYYNSLGDATVTSANARSKGKADDVTSAGTVYVYAEGTGVAYSGSYYVGHYVISQRPVTAKVNTTSRKYDGTTAMTTLTASFATVTGSTIQIEKLIGTLENANAGSQYIVENTVAAVKATTFSSDDYKNYAIGYSSTGVTVTIEQVTLSLSGEKTLEVVFGRDYDLTKIFNTGLTEVDNNLEYKLVDDQTNTVSTALTMSQNVLTVADYDALKNIPTITLNVTYDASNLVANDNYKISDAPGKTVTLKVKKAETVVYFGDSLVNQDTQTITFPAYVRPSEIRAHVENDSANYAGIWTGFAATPATDIKSNYTDGETKAVTTVTYEYWQGDTKLNYYPSKAGTYTVKAYVKVDDTVNNKKASKNVDEAVSTLTLVISASKATSGTTGSVTASNGYVVNADGTVSKEDGSTVASTFIDYAGDTYYVDENSKIVTGKVLLPVGDKTYAIAKDGSLIKNNKTTIGGKDYVTDENGAVLKDQLATTPSGNTVYVGKDGAVVKNQVVTVNKKKYYANSTGRIVKNGFFNTKRGNKVYADKNGVLKVGVVFTVKGYKYYAGTNGAIATNGLTKTKSGNTVFATSSGKLKVNKTFTYKGVKYKANKKGVVTKVK